MSALANFAYPNREGLACGTAALLALAIIAMVTLALPRTTAERPRFEFRAEADEPQIVVAAPEEPLPTPPVQAPETARTELTEARPQVVPTALVAPVDPAQRTEPGSEGPKMAPAQVPTVVSNAAPISTATNATNTPAPVTAPSAKAPEKASSQSSYESALRAYLEKIKRYPTSREARQTRPRGVVRVWLELERSGRLLDAGIVESSGSNLLDAEALRTLRSGTYPAFGNEDFASDARHRFTASLSYSIE